VAADSFAPTGCLAPRPANAIRRPLEGQRALVTGSSSGIGAAIARGLAEAGAAVAVNYGRDSAAAQAVVSDILALGGDAFAWGADVSQESEVEAMFAAAIGRFGSLDIVVNNAGLQRDAALDEMSLHDWDRVIAVNLTGQFLCSRAAVREFLRRGIDRNRSRATGKIICISSVHDRIPWAGHANYAASKGGVMLLMQTMAQELAVHRIRVNSISPGAIKTPINSSAWNTPEAEAGLLKLIPYGRVGEPRDIANAAVWLASDASDYVTGATLYVDGGMTLYPGFEKGG
jgi:glucose 1-dehydrogenase